MPINEVTSAIIGAAIHVHQELGPGLLESAYRICLAHELQQAAFEVVQERPIPVVYKGVRLDCGFGRICWWPVWSWWNARPKSGFIRWTRLSWHRTCA